MNTGLGTFIKMIKKEKGLEECAKGMYYVSNLNLVKSGACGITEHTTGRITCRNYYLCKKRMDDICCSF